MERFVVRCYHSLAMQRDADDVEFIFVNDGSSDKTHEIIESNRERILNAGIEFKYINLEILMKGNIS